MDRNLEIALICALLAALGAYAVRQRFAQSNFGDTVGTPYRREDHPVLFWVVIAIAIAVTIGFAAMAGWYFVAWL